MVSLVINVFMNDNLKEAIRHHFKRKKDAQQRRLTCMACPQNKIMKNVTFKQNNEYVRQNYKINN